MPEREYCISIEMESYLYFNLLLQNTTNNFLSAHISFQNTLY